MNPLTFRDIEFKVLTKLLEHINEQKQREGDSFAQLFFEGLRRRSLGTLDIEETMRQFLDFPDRKLFTYGTLQPGEANHALLSQTDGAWVQCFAVGNLIDTGWGMSYGFPAFSWNPEGRIVEGNLFSSSRIDWAKIDRFEGQSYERILIPVFRDTRQHVYAIANLYAVKGGKG